MHELLAACMLVTDRDSLDISTPVPSSTTSGRVVSPQISAAMQATLDRNYVEHDAFGLFQQLMRPAKAFYEWRAEEGPVSGGCCQATPPSSLCLQSQASRAIIGAPQAPIIERCNHIHTQLLRRIDPQLWERLETEGVEAQIWTMFVGGL
jgi:TBC1 domain family protein 5